MIAPNQNRHATQARRTPHVTSDSLSQEFTQWGRRENTARGGAGGRERGPFPLPLYFFPPLAPHSFYTTAPLSERLKQAINHKTRENLRYFGNVTLF